MDPPHINFIDYNSILVVNPSGQMKQLFTPFKVQVLNQTTLLTINTWVIVDEIRQHQQYRLLYRIGNTWWPYNAFRLSVLF